MYAWARVTSDIGRLRTWLEAHATPPGNVDPPDNPTGRSPRRHLDKPRDHELEPIEEPADLTVGSGHGRSAGPVVDLRRSRYSRGAVDVGNRDIVSSN